MVAKGWEDATSASVSATTGAVGAGLAATGNPLAGAIVAGGGQIAASMFQVFKPTPRLPGPSGMQLVAAERANNTASQASAMEGMAPAEVAALDELSLRRNVRSTAIANAYNSVYTLGPAEQEILVEKIVSKQQEEAAAIRAEYLTADSAAIRRNMELKIAANSQAAVEAARISDIERNNELKRLDMQAQKYEILGQAVPGATDLITGAMQTVEAQKQKLLEEQKASAVAKQKLYGNSMPQSAGNGVYQSVQDKATGTYSVPAPAPAPVAIPAAVDTIGGTPIGWNASTSEWQSYIAETYPDALKKVWDKNGMIAGGQ